MMELRALEKMCDDADAQCAKYGWDESSVVLVIPRRASGYARGIRLTPRVGPVGEILCENASGRTVARFKTRDLRKFIALARRECDGT